MKSCYFFSCFTAIIIVVIAVTVRSLPREYHNLNWCYLTALWTESVINSAFLWLEQEKVVVVINQYNLTVIYCCSACPIPGMVAVTVQFLVNTGAGK